MLNIITKNNTVLENKRSKTLLYTIATLVTLTMSLGSKSVYAMNGNAPIFDFSIPNINETNYQGDRSKPRIKFTKEIDSQIKYLFEKEKIKSWTKISEQIFGSANHAKQVRGRYFNYLVKNPNKDPWTPEEDKVILKKITEYGENWNVISIEMKIV